MKSLNKYYIKQKENELKKLEEKKIKLSREIEEENSRLRAVNEQLEKLKSENTLIENHYNSLKDMIIHRGIILDIENNSYNIKEWDNLFIEKKRNRYVVSFKNGEELYNLEEDMCILLQDLFLEGYSCSIVVIRVISKLIKVQFRFLNREE